MPEISVLMGTYNEKNRTHVAQAIDSILGQTFTDFELIICDDGSEEEFYEWLRQYCRKDPRIRLLRSTKNHGLAAVLNKCFRCSSGRYVARMDADDISKKDRLLEQAAFLREHKEYALAGCDAEIIGDEGVWGIRRMERIPQKTSFLRTSPFIHPSVMLRREVIEQMHGYRVLPRTLRVEDYDFFMRLYAAGYQGYNLTETLFQYREDQRAYGKRKYRYRVNECWVRYQGFRALGILKGNLRYVLKPLAAGLVPGSVMRWLHGRNFAEERGGVS